MGQMVLGSVGATLGGRILGPIIGTAGQRLGRRLGRAVGARLDDALFGNTHEAGGARMQELHVQGASEGASLPVVFGRVRLSGTLIWASRFRERRERRAQSKGGPKVESVRYTVSFAVAICEGVINRVERAWANGRPFDLNSVTHRLYRGDEDQSGDPVIEAVEGVAPPYRGTCYVVFEEFPLDDFGDSIPHFSFEVVRAPREGNAPSSLESLTRSICLIPGSGEFVLADRPVRRVVGPGREVSENAHAIADVANLPIALDQLITDLPRLEQVVLVVSWYGDDLRCGACTIRPGVERGAKVTRPLSWRVCGIGRQQARVVSQVEGGPAFGGTPSDATVLEAILALRARGLRVGLYPFLMMDIPSGNALPNPYGGVGQPAFPWRGRITPTPAPGQAGSVDKTAAAMSQVSAFFGACTAQHFGAATDTTTYLGPDEWSFRRFILHYAKLAQMAGGVDTFIVGSELRGVTTARSAQSSYPAVEALRALAGDVRSMLGPSTGITYAADWSEYFGHQPADGTGDVHFHLDPLWADPAINAVGVDWYPPLTDWRDGEHVDRSLTGSLLDTAYLQSRIEGGEAFDWHYADDDARRVQLRSPITDGNAGKPWVFRPKDLRRWWSNLHFNRPGGVEASQSTAWVPQSKPFWFVELGCAAVDKGSNAPNLFVDPKSSESAKPPFSSGLRDDRVQRATLESYLTYWRPDANRNPTSAIYGGAMIDPAQTSLWAYDARPFPQFPALTSVWRDGPQWATGHWLNGRVGMGDLASMLQEVCARAGLASESVDVSAIRGAALGCIIDGPAPMRAVLESLALANDLEMIERAGVLIFRPRSLDLNLALTSGSLVTVKRQRIANPQIDLIRIRYIDAARDYQFGVALAHAGGESARSAFFDLPLTLSAQDAEGAALRTLDDVRASSDVLEFETTVAFIGLEIGDVITLDDTPTRYRIVEQWGRRFRAVGLPIRRWRGGVGATASAAPAPIPDPTPELIVFSAPPLVGAEADDRPIAAVFAAPWRGAMPIFAGAEVATARQVGAAAEPARMGVVQEAFGSGPIGRWDEATRIHVMLHGGLLESVPRRALLDGDNGFAVLAPDGSVEILQARQCVLNAEGGWTLSGLLRGQQGTKAPVSTPAGSLIVALDSALARLDIGIDARLATFSIIAPRWGRSLGEADAATQSLVLGDRWARPIAPCHLRARRAADGAIHLRWIRRARLGGDPWEAGEPPLGEAVERYRLEILTTEGLVRRSVETTTSNYVYSVADQSVDFPNGIATLRVRVAQWSQRCGFGEGGESILGL